LGWWDRPQRRGKPGFPKNRGKKKKNGLVHRTKDETQTKTGGQTAKKR